MKKKIVDIYGNVVMKNCYLGKPVWSGKFNYKTGVTLLNIWENKKLGYILELESIWQEDSGKPNKFLQVTEQEQMEKIKYSVK